MSDEQWDHLSAAASEPAGTTLAEATPYGFLSSRIEPLRRQRQAIHRACKGAGVPLWVSEQWRPELQNKPLVEVADACLANAWEAQIFVLLLEGTYGDTASAELGDLSVLELEVALAALSGRSIIVFRLVSDADKYDERLRGLVDTIGQLRGAIVRTAPRDDSTLGVQVAALVLEHSQSRAAAEARDARIHRRLFRWLDPRTTHVERWLSTSQLTSAFSLVRPLPDGIASIERAQELLAGARGLPRGTQLLRLWSALRHLSANPWAVTEDPRVLRTWLELFTEWDRATAWLGHHEAAFLGRVAVQAERHRLCQRLSDVAPSHAPAHSEEISASLLYSVAKQQAPLLARRRLFRRALSVIAAALDTRSGDVSGLLSTRAYIRLRLGYPCRARRDSGRGLTLRMASAGEPLHRIGESQATYGWMLIANLRFHRGLAWLQRGVRNLLSSGRGREFTVRAMRQLGVALALNLRTEDALGIWRQAESLALEAGAREQALRLRTLILAIDRWRSFFRMHRK